jgi:ribosomal protein S18 acetylase RimI-like enzyme
MRSRGLGQKLVQHLLDEGKALGRTQAGLDVSVENPRAHELYLRMGFKDIVEHTSTLRNEHAIVPSHIRMERAI